MSKDDSQSEGCERENALHWLQMMTMCVCVCVKTKRYTMIRERWGKGITCNVMACNNVCLCDQLHAASSA